MNKTISKNFRTLTREGGIVRCYLYGQLMNELSCSEVKEEVAFDLTEPVGAFVDDALVTVNTFNLSMTSEELAALLSDAPDAVETVKDVEAPVAAAPTFSRRGRR